MLTKQRNKIISELYSSKDFNDCINKMEPEHLRADLKQEIILSLIEKPDELICSLAARGELKYYVVRMILNQVISNSSSFTKRYRTVTECFNNDRILHIPDTLINGRIQKEMREEPVYMVLKRLQPLAYQTIPTYIDDLMPMMGWYDQYMMSLYMKLSSFRKMEVETRIPWESCYYTVRKSIAAIRKEVLHEVK